MVDPDFELPSSFDPFTDPDVADDTVSFSRPGKGQVHIRVQQMRGKKFLTTVQGLNEDVGYDIVLKKELCCNSNVVQDKELGKIIQLQGDQRKNVSRYLVKAELVQKDNILIHGF
ncbi:Protein translation factor SUI1-like protein [Morus notabilis]|uniref:Protein translation factor SUI1-like protein n=1 Tax=Morus notabilis TaxID=981085 RepID=W9QW46_9ROSA|nr:protein translation factor SUI1 homolog [Morus notabilis]EXB40143.1 Protein translation factor SUI1-like protein [Morus notabilis]